MIVRVQHENEVLDRNDNDQRPEDERKDAQDVSRRGNDGMRSMKAFAESVERARSDVAVDDTNRGKRENEKISTTWRHAFDVPAGGRSVDVRGCCLCHSPA